MDFNWFDVDTPDLGRRFVGDYPGTDLYQKYIPEYTYLGTQLWDMDELDNWP